MKVIPFPTNPLADATWEEVEKERLVSGAPKRAWKSLYSSKSDEFHTGIYECTPGSWHVTYNEDEFCTLIEGRLKMTSEQGDTQEFQAPASFVIPSGYKGTWEALTKLRKFFVIYEKTKS
ncbi:MAG: DUF861 domain-containing protein [Alphaproteobacteria bacterium]|nr:MAG: DUF861 domain-containing protein [Alphaproteobacteria bacterium]